MCNNNTETEILEYLKTHDPDINVSYSDGNFPLLIATALDKHDLMVSLIELGCNVDQVNDEGFNALNLALCRYIEVLHKRNCWTHSFVDHNKLKLNPDANEMECEFCDNGNCEKFLFEKPLEYLREFLKTFNQAAIDCDET